LEASQIKESTEKMRKLFWVLLIILVLPGGVPAATGPSAAPEGKTIRDMLIQPWGKLFWIERKGGKYRMGDPSSKYDGNLNFEDLTFDISNNKVLANVGIQGLIKNLTIYRDSYRVSTSPGNLPGVWMAKDNSSFGPYSFKIHIEGNSYDLANVDWDFRTGLLDNIFPITELRDPQGRFLVRLLTFTPVSADGSERIRGVVYGLQLENISREHLAGSVELPEMFANQRQDFSKHPIHMWEPFEFEFGIGDSKSFQRETKFQLAPGEQTWVPLILYMAGDSTVEEVNQKGTAAWLAESWTYYRRLLGRLEISGDGYLAEFFERQLLQAFSSIAMSASGKLAGTNWGSYPATREIWMKDAYYSCLPIAMLDPSLAKPILFWFTEFGIRQKGSILQGGINHSLSLSVASLVLGGMYYDLTGDKAFFLAHPEFKKNWDSLVTQMIASRTDVNIWLFPSRFISDGALEGDYHTGTNVVVWRALMAYSRLLAEVFGDARGGQQYAEIADMVHAAILAKTVIEGPYGRQFIEGVDQNGTPPRLISDGEESDTTLIPFYGFLPCDNDIYLHYMRFSMSEHNQAYQPLVRAITWAGSPATPLTDRVPATAPGYMKGIALGNDGNELFGEHGYYSEVRCVTDADGSVFWWPFGWNSNPPVWDYDHPVRRSIPGKAGWFAGVHSMVFMSRFLGVDYNAPEGKLRFTPSPLLGNRFQWSGFPLGNDRFSVSYERNGTTVRVSAVCESGKSMDLEALVPVENLGGALVLLVDGVRQNVPPKSRYLGRDTILVRTRVPAGKAVKIVAEGK
jgi:hypothetical protein